MEIEAKVLWWDKRDGYGICVDADGNEYYVDTSVCRNREAPIESQLVRGTPKLYGNTLCLQDVRDFLVK